MKRALCLSMLFMTAGGAVHAEPVFMPQAVSTVKKHQGEAGVSAQFGYQKSELMASPGTTYKNRVWQMPLFARYGILDTLEAKLALPITRAIDSSEGLSSTRNADTGIGNLQVGTKWNFLTAPMPLAVALDLDLPTANSRNNAAALGNRYSTQIQQGFNAHLQLVADTPMFCDIVSGHASVGYMNTAAYTTATGGRFNPSDLATFGASVDINLHRWVERLTLSGEMVGNTALTHSKSGSTMNGSDKGTVLEAGPAIRYQVGRWRTHLGFLIDQGKATFRAYNYRVAFGVSALFGAMQ